MDPLVRFALRVSFAFLLALPLLAQQQTAPTAASEYQTIFYKSGDLRLEAYFYAPAGSGPFPLLIYNHGSRARKERTEVPMLFVAQMLSAAGYAVLVPERRGYGKSDGQPFSEEVGQDRGPLFIARLQAEADDVLEAVDYAKKELPIDPKRIAIMGFSSGGIVTTFAATGSDAFVAVIVDQASWDRVPELRRLLIESGGKIRAPILCMFAEGDATTENVKSICASAKTAGASAELVIYPAFTLEGVYPNIAPGPSNFGRVGFDLWRKNVVGFMDKHIGASSKAGAK